MLMITLVPVRIPFALASEFPFSERPDWVWWAEKRSWLYISGAIMGSCYRVGQLFLGMKARYPEYTLSDGMKDRGGFIVQGDIVL